MAADVGKLIMLAGVAGVGGYVIYQYTEYQKVINQINVTDPSGNTAASFENTLPFLSFLMAAFSPPAPGTPAYSALQAANNFLSGATAAQAPAPGTTSSGQTSATSVTTTTPSTGSASSTGGSTSGSNPPPATPLPSAADLTSAAKGASTQSADQWNYYFRILTGYGIEQIYGGNFDAIYGTIQANGQRATGQISAQAFLTLPPAMGLTRTAVSGMSGLGAIARFYTPVVNPMASLVYRANHPSPYRLPVSGGMSGLGAVTQATGFEKALYAGGFIRSRRVR